MNGLVYSPPGARFVAFDISKRSCVVAAVNAQQQIVLSPRKVTIEKLESWVHQNLKPDDQIVLEATFNAWFYHDVLKPLVNKVVVANPLQVKLICQTKVKTDARDALALAKLLAAELIPTVWVPPVEVRELRSLVAHRQNLIHQRTQHKTRLLALLAAQHLLPPAGDPFSAKNEQWWQYLNLPASAKLVLSHQLTLLQSLTPLIDKVEQQLFELSTQGQWASQSAFLIQLPSIGVLTAMTILAAIGDIKRFATAKKLVGYSGLGASIYSSGQVVRTGSITKEGRRELRTALIEAAWIAVEHDKRFKAFFERLSAHIGRGKAIVAVARKLLVVIYHVLAKREADQQAEAEQVARKIMRWGYLIRARGRQELSGPTFTRLQLDWLGLAHKLTTFQYEGRTITLPSPIEPKSSLVT